MSVGVRWMNCGWSALASISRSSTMRAMRSSSSVTSVMVSRRSSGSSPISSRWPRTIVIGVRSSCPASSTKARWVANRPPDGPACRRSYGPAQRSRPARSPRCDGQVGVADRLRRSTTLRSGRRSRRVRIQATRLAPSSTPRNTARLTRTVCSISPRSCCRKLATTNTPGWSHPRPAGRRRSGRGRRRSSPRPARPPTAPPSARPGRARAEPHRRGRREIRGSVHEGDEPLALAGMLRLKNVSKSSNVIAERLTVRGSLPERRSSSRRSC